MVLSYVSLSQVDVRSFSRERSSTVMAVELESERKGLDTLLIKDKQFGGSHTIKQYRRFLRFDGYM